MSHYEGMVWDEQWGMYYDQASGMYYDEHTGHYYDPQQQMYYDPNTQQYYTPDTQQTSEQSYQHNQSDTSQAYHQSYDTSASQTAGTTEVKENNSDVGPCDRRFLSATVNAFPSNSNLRTQSRLPFAILVQPLAQVEENNRSRSINFGVSGVIRCRGCRAYINPFVEFKDKYFGWVCNLCGRRNELPATYRTEILDTEKIQEHPEITEASYDIITPPEYTVRPPQAPTFIFVIDVSEGAVRSGMVSSVCQGILSSLDSLPGPPRTQVAVIAFDSAIHFFRFSSTATGPREYVMTDLEDSYLPVPDDLLVNLESSRESVEKLLTSLPDMYVHNTNPERAFGSALDAAHSLACNIGGKILMFSSGIPTIGVGVLKDRDNPRLLGTEEEHTLLQASTEYYKKKASAFTQAHLMCDVFLFPDQYCDVATLGELARYSGGQVLYYPGFDEHTDSMKLQSDLFQVLVREQSWEAVIRIRVGRGVKIHDYYGNFYRRSADLLAVPNCDADKAYVIEMVNDEAGITTSHIMLQSALLYSDSEGVRRLRIHNMRLPVVSQVAQLYNHVDIDVLATFLVKKALVNVQTKNFYSARELIQFACMDIVNAYKKSAGQYVALRSEEDYPPSLQYLPFMTLAILKNKAFKDGSDVPIDVRSALHYDLMIMGLQEMDLYLRPRLYRIDTFQGTEGLPDEFGAVELPQELNLSLGEIESDYVVLLDNGRNIIIRIGEHVPLQFLSTFFGEQNEDISVKSFQFSYPQGAGQTLANRVWNVIDYLRNRTPIFQDIHILREGDPSELRFRDLMIYDRTMSVMGYNEFLEFLGGNKVS